MNHLTAEPLSNNHKPDPKPDSDAAEYDLLRHLALIGELLERREQLQAELLRLDQLLAQARPQKEALIKRVQELGGQLPSWQVR